MGEVLSNKGLLELVTKQPEVPTDKAIKSGNEAHLNIAKANLSEQLDRLFGGIIGEKTIKIIKNPDKQKLIDLQEKLGVNPPTGKMDSTTLDQLLQGAKSIKYPILIDGGLLSAIQNNENKQSYEDSKGRFQDMTYGIIWEYGQDKNLGLPKNAIRKTNNNYTESDTSGARTGQNVLMISPR